MADVGVAMDAVVQQLRRDCDAAMREVESRGGWFSLGDSASVDAARGAVRQAKAKTEELAGPLRQKVIAGTLSADRWRAIADAQEELLRAQAGYLGGSHGFGSFFNQVVVQSASQVAEGVATAARAAVSWGPWVLGVAVLAGGLWLVRPLLGRAR